VKISFPQLVLALSRRPSYRSATAISFVPGILRAVFVSSEPIPPVPINAICKVSFALIFLSGRFLFNRDLSAAGKIAGAPATNAELITNLFRNDRLE